MRVYFDTLFMCIATLITRMSSQRHPLHGLEGHIVGGANRHPHGAKSGICSILCDRDIPRRVSGEYGACMSMRGANSK